MERHSFALEQLEGRALFSVVAPLDAPPMSATLLQSIVQAATIKHPLTNAFNVAGTFTHPLGNPDAGSQYIFAGSGKTDALGKFTLSGHVQTPGLIANGHASGVLIITTSKGTIHLTVNGPPQDPGVLPPSLSFSIFRGTGSYLHSSGKCKITLSASGTTHKFLFRFKPTT